MLRLLLRFGFALSFVATACRAAPAAFQVEDTADAVRVTHGEVTLLLAKRSWQAKLIDHGVEKFCESHAPAFRVGGSWWPLGSIETVKATATELTLGVQLARGDHATATISAFGPQGFRLIAVPDTAKADAVRGSVALATVEEIYGFGEMWNGRVAQRGAAFDLWDRSGTPDECAYMPYFVSTRNYAFFLSYGGRVHFDVGRRRADEIAYEYESGRLEYTLVAGESIPRTVQSVLTEVGLPARPPRWAFEPWAWLMSDPEKPSASIETLKDHHFVEMVQRFRALDIPVGVTWFEPPWQTARTTFVPSPAFSTDVRALVARLRELGVRTLAWTVPYTTPKAPNWSEAIAQGYLLRPPEPKATGTVGISASGELTGNAYTYVDFFNPAAVVWWQAQIAPAVDLGLSGFKLDDGQAVQADAILHGGRRGADYHNSYAYEYNRAFGEVLRRKLGDDHLIIPRAAWLGSSAWANFKWPGDLTGSFANNGLPSSLYSSLSLAFCGVPFVSTDIGGFMNRPAPEQVWVRWAQFGAMLPGMQTLHMPWHYSAPALAHYRYLSWLHTDLVPYWQSLAQEAAATGAPVVRPLVWTFQEDIECWRVDDEFTVGSSLLVAPIINPEMSRQVYLPPGRWIDFWHEDRVLEGARTVEWFDGWNESRWRFPLYLREGAIIPLEVVNDVTGFGSADSRGSLTLAIWPKRDGASHFTVHDRDGPVSVAVASAGTGVRISLGASRQPCILRVRLPSGQPTRVLRDGEPLPMAESAPSVQRASTDMWWHDPDRGLLWIKHAPGSGAASVVTVETVP